MRGEDEVLEVGGIRGGLRTEAAAETDLALMVRNEQGNESTAERASFELLRKTKRRGGQ